MRSDHRHGAATLAYTIAAMVLLVILSGCRDPEVPDDTDPTAARIADAQQAIALVGTEQALADEALDAALEAVRNADTFLRQVRMPAAVIGALGTLDAVRDDLDHLDIDTIRTGLRGVASSVDRARLAVLQTRAGVDEAAHDYLDAQDVVLVAVHAHAGAGDAVAQLIEQHRATYLEAIDAVDEVAADTDGDDGSESLTERIEVALVELLEPLAIAQDELRRFRADRAETARALNEASADAAALFERLRPFAAAHARDG